MFEQCRNVSENRSWRGLIAWLSVCILTAAWAPQLEPPVRNMWAAIGSFGLAAAVALDLAGRVHHDVKKNSQRKVAERRIERNVARISVQNAVPAGIGKMLETIAADNRLRAACPLEMQSWPHDAFRVAELSPLSDSAIALHTVPKPAMKVDIRDISVQGVGFFHSQPIDSRQILLTFSLLDGESISLVVELKWQHHLADGKYSSGGSLIGVRTPTSNIASVGSAAG